MATAKTFRDTFRAMQPIRYSSRRQSDEQTPPTSPTHNSEPMRDRAETNASQSRESEPLNSNHLEQSLQTDSHEIQIDNSTQDSSDQTQNDVDNISTHSHESTNSSIKSIMPNVVLGEEEFSAIESVFGHDYDNDNANDSPSAHSSTPGTPEPGNAGQMVPDVILGPDETAFWNGGVLKVTKKYDGDCEITYTYGEKITPKRPAFEIKVNDSISMNIPFKENVSPHHFL